MRHHTYGYIYAILAAFFFALIAIIGKGLVSGGTHPFQISFYQYLFTILILGTWLYVRKPEELRHGRKNFFAFALLGFFGGGATTLLFYSALQYLDAGITSMLLFINPVYIAIFFAVSKIRKMTLINYISVIIAVSGATLVLDIFSGSLKFSVAGLVLGILSGIAYAFFNVFADLKFKAEDPNIINFYSCIASLLLTTILLTFSGIGFAINTFDLVSIVFLAIFSGILPEYFLFKSFQYIGSEKVSVIASVELPMTLIMAFTLLNEHMRSIQLFGVALIIISTVLLHYNDNAEAKKD